MGQQLARSVNFVAMGLLRLAVDRRRAGRDVADAVDGVGIVPRRRAGATGARLRIADVSSLFCFRGIRAALGVC